VNRGCTDGYDRGVIGRARRWASSLTRFGRENQESLHALHDRVGELRHEAGELRRENGELRHLIEEVRRENRRAGDTLDLVSRRLALRAPVVRVVFLVHNVNTFSSYEPVYRLMADDPSFAPLVLSMANRLARPDALLDEEVNHRGLEERGIPHLRLTATDPWDDLLALKALQPDLILRQSQWDADYAPAFHSRELRFAPLAYVPYEILNIVQNIGSEHGPDTATESEFHRGAWRVFCTSDRVVEQLQVRGSVAGHRYEVTGHPRVDQLAAAEPDWPSAAPAGGRVLWSAHHSIDPDWTAFGTFLDDADRMVAWARERADLDFVFSPHPSLSARLRDQPELAERGDSFERDWSALPNTRILAPGRDYVPVLAAADAVVTDGLSLLLEAQIAGRPVVFLEREGHRAFNDVGERIVTGTHRVPDADAARAVVDALLADGDPLADIQRATVADLLPTRGAARRIVASISAGINAYS